MVGSASVICPICHTAAEPGDEFCAECGASLSSAGMSYDSGASTSACATCGAPLEEGASFCVVCGAPVVAEVTPIQTEPPVIGGRTCPHCGCQVEMDAVFCTECGQAIDSFIPAPGPTIDPIDVSQRCHVCGAPLEAGADFCTVCGAPVASRGTVGPVDDDGSRVQVYPANREGDEANERMRMHFHSPEQSL